MTELPHFDEDGNVHMVDIGNKSTTHRVAVASAVVSMQPVTLQRIQNQDISKGDVLQVARIAGVMATKRTSDLIPLCHPLMIQSVSIEFNHLNDRQLQVTCKVETEGKTGVEMEAMTAVSVASLTVYDMCKSIDRSMTIGDVCLEEKLGGKSGHFKRSS